MKKQQQQNPLAGLKKNLEKLNTTTVKEDGISGTDKQKVKNALIGMVTYLQATGNNQRDPLEIYKDFISYNGLAVLVNEPTPLALDAAKKTCTLFLGQIKISDLFHFMPDCMFTSLKIPPGTEPKAIKGALVGLACFIEGMPYPGHDNNNVVSLREAEKEHSTLKKVQINNILPLCLKGHFPEDIVSKVIAQVNDILTQYQNKAKQENSTAYNQPQPKEPLPHFPTPLRSNIFSLKHTPHSSHSNRYHTI